MMDSTQKRGELIKHLEEALVMVEELNDGMTAF